MSKVKLSIIIVHYKVKKELFRCLRSVCQSDSKVPYEIIVVDNDEIGVIGKELKKNFPKINYIKSTKNIGYGAGNNLGAKYAKGEFLFFLNPDAEVYTNCIDSLIDYLRKHKHVGIVAPLLHDRENKLFPLQGARELIPFNAIFTFSFINKLFPNNIIARKYWMTDEWNKKSVKEVACVPGTAFVIRREIFEKIKGFDERFFLYFEENDLCKRVRKLGWKIIMYPPAKIYHALGRSTKKSNYNISRIFNQSRLYYFRKHFGIIPAFIVETILRINKYTVLIGIIILAGTFLRFYRLNETMIFIGDQGWIYLSARDMLLTGKIPLVGITSSHTWLHQGPLWTYLLAFILSIFNFNPIAPAYFTALLGVFTAWFVYKVGNELFSKRVGLIAFVLYATSPLVIIHSRMPYHTNLIPLFTLLFILSLYKWIKGKIYFFPLTILFLAVLYNLELATTILWFVLLVVLCYGVWKKKEWLGKIINKKILFLALTAFIVPMIPVLIYDVSHGFPQTLKFVLWIGYRVLRFFGFPSTHNNTQETSLSSMVSFSFLYYQRLVFLGSSIVAFTIFVLSFGVFIKNCYEVFKKRINKIGFRLLALIIIITFSGYFVNKTSSEAYLPTFFPLLIYVVALFFDKIMKIKIFFIPVFLSIVIIVLLNIYFLVSSEYLTGKLNGYGITFSERLSIATEIVREANVRDYNLIGKGNGSQFESFTMNYEYLTWWLGHAPSRGSKKLQYIIQENKNGVSLIERK